MRQDLCSLRRASTCSICGGRKGSDVLLHINNGARIDAAAGLSLLVGKERPDFTSLRKEGRYTHVCIGGVQTRSKGKWFMGSSKLALDLTVETNMQSV